ncbi:hypothetical protein MauCBS54593_004068 [Microsporum audouinii]
MSYYLSKPMLKFYYDEIKKSGSMKSTVNNFWNNALLHYFTQEKFYGIEQDQCQLDGTTDGCADFAIRRINNGESRKVVLMKNETQAYHWGEAVEQLTQYLKLVRAEQGSSHLLYAAITIGTYARFYYLEPQEQTLTDHPTTRTGDFYELKLNEDEIHNVLSEWVEKTNH